MPRPRFERAAPEKRNALLEVATQEFAEHGYDGASINRILAGAGLSKGAFYYYFDDKADLAAAVIAKAGAAWIASLTALPIPSSADQFWNEMEQLNARATAELEGSPVRGDLLARLSVALARNPDLVDRLGPFMKEVREHLTALYRRGQELGAVRSDIDVEALMTILQGAKLAVGLAMLPADRVPTSEELARFKNVNFDCMRRLAAAPGLSTRPAAREEKAT
ncbi:MAG: TetR/AcrR family transcriptional regulator [Myxococcales bacterium]|nr:TetR/AcrR family transcriptional regulator [Myxococcales bacterium]MCB9581543.1 TetR/AcrR family transcriptional regulator [Polyangiaceae bacterium]